MRRPRPAARTMALVGVTDIPEISRTIIRGLADHIMVIRPAHDPDAIVIGHDGCATGDNQASAACGPRLAAFFFLSPCLRKLTPIWSPLTQAGSQRRYASPVDDSSRKNSF